MHRIALRTLILICHLLAISVAHAQQTASQDASKRLLIAYDSSNSMWGELTDKSRKYEAGRTALTALLNSQLQGREVAFRAYGHRRKDDCEDTELMVPFAAPVAAKTAISQAVSSIRPTGKTPITLSLKQGRKDFDGGAGDILLISDGIETCDIDPCELMEQWQESKVNIRVHVVGVGLTEFEREAMACIARVSGGRYFDAESAQGFEEALTEAGTAIDTPAEAKPVPSERAYALKITAVDDQGKSYIAKGRLLQEGTEVQALSTHSRNVVGEPGDYELEIGPVLRDGSIYEPVTQALSITSRGDTRVTVQVKRPALVTAEFSEEGKEHRGSAVTAYQQGQEVFSFRASDEALARPGDYEFRAQPNADNSLSINGTLAAGEHTRLKFELTTTIKFYVRYVLPNGEKIRRGSQLWRDGEKLYDVYSGNPTTIKPGTYELRSEHKTTPLTPVEIDIRNDGETIEVPLDVGWVAISYAPSDMDYASEPDRAFLQSLDRGNSAYARIGVPTAAKPGPYQVNPQTSKGFMEPIAVTVKTNETVEAVFQPKPLGEIVVRFAQSEHYDKPPDRASVYALDGQAILNGFMRPGVAKKFLPGRYKVDPRRADTLAQEVVVKAHEQTEVVLEYRAP